MMVKKINNPWPPLASAGTGALQRALGSGRGGEEDRERRQEDPARVHEGDGEKMVGRIGKTGDIDSSVVFFWMVEHDEAFFTDLTVVFHVSYLRDARRKISGW